MQVTCKFCSKALCWYSKAALPQVQHEDESKWVADAPVTGLVLVSEGDPPPGAHLGHMSFSSFNPELQKLQVGHCPGAPPDAHPPLRTRPRPLS